MVETPNRFDAAIPSLGAPSERFVVVAYVHEDRTLREVELVEAPCAESALVLGQTAAAEHATVVVRRQTKDALGIERSIVLRHFARDR